MGAFDHRKALEHIDAIMPWTPSGSTIPWLWGRTLIGSRRSLSTSIQRAVENRRESDRHAVAPARRGAREPDWALVNLSRSGLAVRVRGEAPFARGEKFSISLLGGAIRAEIEGEVRWTRSQWSYETAGSDRKTFHQTAGLSICTDWTPELEGRWQFLLEAVSSRSNLVGIGLVSQRRKARPEGVVLTFHAQPSRR